MLLEYFDDIQDVKVTKDKREARWRSAGLINTRSRFPANVAMFRSKPSDGSRVSARQPVPDAGPLSIFAANHMAPLLGSSESSPPNLINKRESEARSLREEPSEIPHEEEVDSGRINSILHIRTRWTAAHLSPPHGGTLPWRRCNASIRGHKTEGCERNRRS